MKVNYEQNRLDISFCRVWISDYTLNIKPIDWEWPILYNLADSIDRNERIARKFRVARKAKIA